MSDADRAAERIERLFGPVHELEARTIHVAAIWEEAPARRLFLAVGPGSPASDTDRFVLELARARADAVLTTGAILRDEPRVTHEITSAELGAFRREVLGKSAAPTSVVLTSGRGLDLEHPVLSGPGGAMLLVPESATLPPGVEVPVLRVPQLDPVRAVEALLERFETLALEVGPRVSAALYGATRPPIEELLSSVYLEPDLADRFQGGPFPNPDVLQRFLTLVSTPRVERESSGRWRFERHRRR